MTIAKLAALAGLQNALRDARKAGILDELPTQCKGGPDTVNDFCDAVMAQPVWEKSDETRAAAQSEVFAEHYGDPKMPDELPAPVRRVFPPPEESELLAVDEAAKPPFEKVFPTGYVDMREVGGKGEHIAHRVPTETKTEVSERELPKRGDPLYLPIMFGADTSGMPNAPKTITTTKPTEEQIAQHQREHKIPPSALLPPYSPNEPLGYYRRFFQKKKLGAEDNKATGEAARTTIGVEIQGPTLGVPNANGDSFGPGVWDQAIKEYHKRKAANEVTVVTEGEHDQMILNSPEYMCQQCGKEYLFVDAVKHFKGDDRAALCFCSVDCTTAYLKKNRRWPGVGAEILLGEVQLCTYGRTDEQINEARSALVAKLIQEDRELVEAVIGAPTVVVQDSVVFDVTVEQMELIQRLIRLRRKLPPGFKIVADTGRGGR